MKDGTTNLIYSLICTKPIEFEILRVDIWCPVHLHRYMFTSDRNQGRFMQFISFGHILSRKEMHFIDI